MTTENYYPLSETLVFFELLITESASSMNLVLKSLVKLLEKQMLEKKRSGTLLEIISYVEISQKLLAKQLLLERTS